LIRVSIVAPALAVRAGLRALLAEDSDIEITGEAASLREAGDLQMRLSEGSDVWVIMDTALSPGEGAVFSNLERLLLVDEPPALLLLIEDHADLARLLPGIKARAWGILPLDSTADEMQVAVRALQQGLLVGAPELIEQLLATPAQNRELLADHSVEALTERELQVLGLLAQGLANKQIAVELGISEHTAKFHVSGIYAKLGATSRTEAVRLGVRQGLIVL
jgi:DNA-binding NarL/FixJ family response regulator